MSTDVTLQALEAPLLTSSSAVFQSMMTSLGIPSVIPSQVPVTLTASVGTGPFTIGQRGLTLRAAGWIFQSVNSQTLLVSTTQPTVVQCNAVTVGTTGAIVAGTQLTVPEQYIGLTASANSAPSASQMPTFPTTNWEDVGTTLAMLQTFAAQDADMNSTLIAIALAGFLATAQTAPGNNASLPAGSQPSTSTWLDYLALSLYDETRLPGTNGQFSVTVATASSPYIFGANSCIVIDPATGLRYISTNTTQQTVTSSSALTQTFQAEQAGTAYNGSITQPGYVLTLAAPQSGVTATSANYLSSGTSAIVDGADGESDTAFVQRCLALWPSLIAGPTVETFESYAINEPVGSGADDVSAPITSALVVQGGNAESTATARYSFIGPPVTWASLGSLQVTSTAGFALAGVVLVNALWRAQYTSVDGGDFLGLLWIDTPSGNVNNGVSVMQSVPTGVINAYVANGNIVPPAGDISVVFDTLFAAKPLCTSIGVSAATPESIMIAGTVYAPQALLSVVQSAINAAFAALQQSLVISTGAVGSGVLYVSTVYDLILDAGATRVDLTSPSSDTIPGSTEIFQLDYSGLVYVGI